MSGYVPNNRHERPAPKPEPYNGNFDSQPSRPLVVEQPPEPLHTEPMLAGCVFAKSCNLPDGVIDYQQPGNFIPLESLKTYGEWAVLATGSAISATGTPLQLVGGSTSGTALATRLGGSISLALTEGVATAGVMASTALGSIAMLLPNNSLAPDSAFYTREQYALLNMGRTRARLHIKHLPEGAIDLYGFYTGGKPSWENVPVISAVPRGDQFVADIGQGIELIWTPATDPNDVLGIPALEGAPALPSVWVYPPTEKSDQILVTPVHPPEYQDAIIWFPSTDIQPIYIALSLRHEPGVVTGQGQDITGIWLENAGRELGAPVPSQIADQLRGKQFNSFDAFRRAFWTAVGNDSELSGQFNRANQTAMRKLGNSPRTPSVEQVGGRDVYELHHLEELAKGGALYDVDNLRVMTPKLHIKTHSSKGNTQ
jgi:hypothetical protein